MKLEQYLALGSVSGLKFQSILDTIDGNQYVETIWTCNGISTLFSDLWLNTLENNDAYPIKSLKPICRPLSDLTKPIEHNGEVFVPIERLKKLVDEFGNAQPVFVHVKSIQGVHFEWYSEFDNIRRSVPLSFYIQLISWHFAIGDFEFIPVTEEFNPYK